MSHVDTLTISTSVSDPHVEIIIEDNGPGIPKDKIPAILKGGSTFGKKEGHGIGTTVVREVVAVHEGELKIESELGVGTRFIFRFPVATSLDVNDSDKGQDKDIPRGTIHLEFYEKDPVVVIEDDDSVQEHWRLTFKARGMSVLICGNWEQFDAMGITSKLTKNAIVDYHYNDSYVNGLTIVRRLKERGFEKVYLCTAEYWKTSIQDEARKLSVPVCPKPLPKVEIRTTWDMGHETCDPPTAEERRTTVTDKQQDYDERSSLLTQDSCLANPVKTHDACRMSFKSPPSWW